MIELLGRLEDEDSRLSNDEGSIGVEDEGLGISDGEDPKGG